MDAYVALAYLELSIALPITLTALAYAWHLRNLRLSRKAKN